MGNRLIVLALLGAAIFFWWPQMAERQDSSGNNPTQSTQYGQRIVPPTPVNPSPSIPGANSSKPQSNTGTGSPPEGKPLPRFLGPEWVIVYVTAIYTLFAVFQWLTIRRQANSLDRQIKEARDSSEASARTAADTLEAIRTQAAHMERQAALMERQLEMAERPWLSVEIFPDGDIRYDHLGIIIPVRIEFTNSGKTPAVDIDIEPIFYCLGGDRNPQKIRDTLIRNMRVNRNLTSYTAFPGGKETIPGLLQTHDRKRSFETMRDISGAPGDVICAVAIVCVTYRPTFKTDAAYFTGVICDIGRNGPGGRPERTLVPHETVRQGDVWIKALPSHGTVTG